MHGAVRLARTSGRKENLRTGNNACSQTISAIPLLRLLELSAGLLLSFILQTQLHALADVSALA